MTCVVVCCILGCDAGPPVTCTLNTNSDTICRFELPILTVRGVAPRIICNSKYGVPTLSGVVHGAHMHLYTLAVYKLVFTPLHTR